MLNFISFLLRAVFSAAAGWALVLGLMFVSSQLSAQVTLPESGYVTFSDNVGNERHSINVNADTYKYMLYVNDSFNPYFMEWTGTVYQADNGDIHLLKNNGRLFVRLECVGGRFVTWSYGADKLHSGAR